MSTRLQPYTLTFPDGYDQQAEFEAPFRGYLPDVIVELEGGARHRLSFIDLTRLERALADNARRASLLRRTRARRPSRGLY